MPRETCRLSKVAYPFLTFDLSDCVEIGSGRDAFGRRTDELVTGEGWRNLQTMGLKEGRVLPSKFEASTPFPDIYVASLPLLMRMTTPSTLV